MKQFLFFICTIGCFPIIAMECTPKKTTALNNLLKEAVKKGNVKEAGTLIDQGANPNIYARPYIHEDLNKLLIIAIWRNDENMANLLIAKGAKVDVYYQYEGCCSYYKVFPAIALAARSNLNSVCNSLIKHHADPNAQAANGTTALIIAAQNGNTELCTLLIENGADPEIFDNEGKTALVYAAIYKHKEIVEYLCAKQGIKKIEAIYRLAKHSKLNDTDKQLDWCTIL